MSQPPAPTGSRVGRFFDGLANLISGAGTTADKRTHAFYLQRFANPTQIEASYRTSWIMRKGIDLPASDMTREGREWQIDEDDVDAIETEEKRLGLWPKLTQALVYGRLGGGAMILGIANDDPMTPLDPTTVKPGGLLYLHVLSRWQIGLGEVITDPGDPFFGEPSYFELSFAGGKQLRIHPSRVVPFKGKRVPCLMGARDNDWYWGDSEYVSAIDAVQNAEAALNGFASLIEEAKLDTVTIPGLTQTLATAEGEALVIKRVSVANQLKSTHNTRILDGGRGKDSPGETWETRQVSWTGMPDIVRMYLSTAAAAFDIPATRFLGKSPDGMNATGQGDEQNYRSKIATDQGDKVRPALDRIDAVLLPSAGVTLDAEANYVFPPLSKPTDAERADTFNKRMTAIVALQNTGTIPEPAFSKAVQHTAVEEGWLAGLDGALEDMPEDERFPSENAEEKPQEGGDQLSADGTGGDGSAPVRRAANDSRFADGAPLKTLFVQRKLLNADDVIRWAKKQGLETTLPADDMHVTVAFSRTPVDWFSVGTDWAGDQDGKLRLKPGGPRAVERLGDGDAVALMFASDDLSWRHDRIREAGASWDWPEYRPHITLTWDAAGVDVSSIEPYAGPLVFGPELFAEINDDWRAGLSEE